MGKAKPVFHSQTASNNSKEKKKQTEKSGLFLMMTCP